MSMTASSPAPFPPALAPPQALPASHDATRAAARRVDLALHPDDGMYEAGGDEHYLGCGASALDAILSALAVAGTPRPGAILDFGAGAGRVTRWLRAAFESAAIGACDLRASDLDFCRERFGADIWVSGTDIGALSAPRAYDLIWVGSVFTHLSARDGRALFARLMSWTAPGGVLVLSSIGRAALARQAAQGPFIHAAGWDRIERDFREGDFGYADYEGGAGYGLSLIRPSWWARTVEDAAGARLVLMAEQAWDGLHDVVAVQNRRDYAGTAPFAVEPSAAARIVAARDAEIAARDAEAAVRDAEIATLRARVAALEASTSWRITAPLRRVASLRKG